MFLLSLALLSLPAHAHDVVVFGDSWAAGAADELADVLQAEGFTELTVDGQGVGGTTAEQWAANPSLLPAAVSANPDARWVWLSIGGNDLFAHYYAGNGANNAADFDANLRTMLDALWAAHPDIEVVMFGYDCINFEQSQECILTAWTYFGTSITTPTLNQYFLTDVMSTIEAVAADHPRLTYVDSVLGTLQSAGGVPGAPNALLPSPSRYMSDCIHPNHEGYTLIMEALVDDYWGRAAPTAGLTPAEAGACVGEVVRFSSTSSGAAATHWLVDDLLDGEGELLDVSFGTAGPHVVTVEARNGAWVEAASATVTVADAPLAEAGDDLEICRGEVRTLGRTGADGVDYAWTPTTGLDDPTLAAPRASPAETTTYTLTATSGGVCATEDTVTVTVLPADDLVIDGPTGATTGEPAVFTVDATGEVTWTVEGAEATVSEDGRTATVTWDAAGTWTVTARAASDDACPTIGVFEIDVLDSEPSDNSDTGVDGVIPADGAGGCGCSGAPGPLVAWPLALLGLVGVRRRSARERRAIQPETGHGTTAGAG